MNQSKMPTRKKKVLQNSICLKLKINKNKYVKLNFYKYHLRIKIKLSLYNYWGHMKEKSASPKK